MKRSISKLRNNRRGIIAVLSAVMFIVMLAMIAFAVDIGYIGMVKTQLQVAADSAALAAAGSSNQSQSGMVQVARAFAQYHQVAGRQVVLNTGDVQFGLWDVNTRTFTALPSGQMGTAVKVTVTADASHGGEAGLFFGRVLGKNSVPAQASAVAMVNPRDIAFVVDLSGSMNWDTTPGKPHASTTLIQQVYDDFGFGAYPGTLEYRQSGSITSWMNGQLKRVMPNAVPTPDTTSADSKAYWQAYYDSLGSWGQVGYKSYLQYIMDKGRDEPVVPEVKDRRGNITQNALYSPLSTRSGACPYHSEITDGGTFQFPPREMPSHAVRRAIIAALEVIRERNATITDAAQRDKVSLIVFDSKNTGSDSTHVRVLKALTDNYTDVMNACTVLQACNSNAASTDSEGGLICAHDHIRATTQGGVGRENTNKVIVFLTDGNPNLYESPNSDIDQAKRDHPGGWGGDYSQNAALMQAMNMQGENWSTYAVGVGLDGSQAFMDLMANKAGTAINGAAYPIADDATTYETTLKGIFDKIVTNPKLRLVQ